MPSKDLDRFPIRAEFQNLDFRSHRELFEFSCHPFMRKVTDEFLEPMAQFFPLIHSEYAADPSSKTERETSTIHQHIRSYMDHVEQISDIIVRYHDLAAACRIPCPGAAWLHVVMEAEALYGFEGDEDPLSKVIMKGKLFSAYRYSRKIHQNAVEFVSQVALIYDIMFAWAKGSNTPPSVDPRAIKILRMAEDFDRRFGRPSKGYVPNHTTPG
ncbi:hypothetical protein B0H11DRAFT_1932344 [Mycena galericulata]|nr:hypothetical protein B0H11DRAFT_1932344 [Mycena galericulata]